MKITFISDTHTLHRKIDIETDLPGGDLLIHAGDIMNSGKINNELIDFCEWFSGIDSYKHKIFIAGNHDIVFEDHPTVASNIISRYPGIKYLQDDSLEIEFDGRLVKLYGSPWQPYFHNWAFNLPRNGDKLRKVWENIPTDTDILVTHTPPQGILDTSGEPYLEPNLGCELLRDRIEKYPPKIHVFGHIHGSYGHRVVGNTSFFNASLLTERYNYSNRPIHIEWDI